MKEAATLCARLVVAGFPFERWVFAAANHADVTLARELVEGLEEELVVGDKAYIGIGVLTPNRSNMAETEG